MILVRIIEVVFPLIAVILVGVWAGRKHQPEMEVANRLNMDYFVPALVFGILVGGDFRIAQYSGLMLGAFILIAGLGMVGLLAARLSNLHPRTFIPPMMFNNCGNLGLPLALLAFGKEAMPAAVIMMLVSNVLHFSFGAWLMDHHARLTDLWKIPVLFVTMLGLALNLGNIAVWPPLLMAFHLLGEISVPLMMFALGVRLADMNLAESYSGLLIAVLRPLSGMALAYGIGYGLELSEIQRAQLILFGALPPAVLNYIFAERYHQEPEKVASMVMIGNVAALLFVPLALLLVLPH